MPSVRIVKPKSLGHSPKPNPAQAAKVLIWVRHTDLAAWFEVWGKKGTQVYICEDLWVPGSTCQTDQAVEALTRKRMPRPWENFLLNEAQILTTWTIERRRPSEEMRRLE
ncbi:MAG TPA: hypothetical protein PK777_16880, partial [Thermoguttaceae bacterium]|nr:hypothetical protein [Thermoguttaceae bacterium]HPP54631.1 hypothetical protein [Thermoguttaceae bacterium]